ncbi:hypothetical protein H8S95_00650 [Pontibacter sp. KCTC 32443]|uniref:hypothetical protein n=1 Tax=Pontibacter TaxID=323449 RepID=UPI00164D51FF|nr:MULTISPECIES: hypothetical protein [Pontibacter]MBC5772558.1 hypothetical protein [Pontibacter sp. KCTC 32443]
MKTKLYLLLSLLLILSGCAQETDDFISKHCPGSCTVITGKLTTDGRNKPLAGVKLDVIWDESNMLGGETRRKAVTTTDTNGNYILSFLLRDDELQDSNTPGIIKVNAHINETKFLSEPGSTTILTAYELGRDTTISLNYNLPQKAIIKVQAQNTAVMQTGDYMYTCFIFDIGESAEDQNCMQTLYWSKTTPEDQSEVAANQQVIIRTEKRKAGTETVTEDTVTVPPGQVYTYQVTF